MRQYVASRVNQSTGVDIMLKHDVDTGEYHVLDGAQRVTAIILFRLGLIGADIFDAAARTAGDEAFSAPKLFFSDLRSNRRDFPWMRLSADEKAREVHTNIVHFFEECKHLDFDVQTPASRHIPDFIRDAFIVQKISGLL
jgi:hypothetical protein